MGETRQIFVAETGASPGDVIARLPGALRWVYLGTDDGAMCRWKSALAAFGPPEDIADLLHRTAEAYRQPFLRWLTRTAAAGAAGWWFTRLAERNTFSESMFQDLCYVDVARQLARSDASALLVLSSSADLLETIVLSTQGPTVTWIARRPTWFRSPKRAVRTVALWGALWGYYVVDALRTLAAARLSRLLVCGRRPLERQTSGKLVLLHTCIDEAYFEGEGGQDRYFTVLPRALRQAGHDVVTLPWVYNVSRSRLSAFLWLRRNGQHLIPEDYYTPWDYLRSALAVIRAADQIPRAGQFDRINLRVFLAAARQEQLGAFGLARFVRYRAWVRQLARRGVSFDVVVDTFENYGSERAFVLALRAESPNTLIVGYQHYMAPLPFQLAHWSIPDEWPVAPYADAIVCSSPMNARLLSAMGFPPARLRVGPSLRFLHLLQPVQLEGGPDLVLMLLPLQTDLACELVRKVLDALDGEKGLQIRVKFHPMMNRRHRTRVVAAAGGRLPAEVSGSVEANLDRVACAVGAATSACLDVLLRGVPYVPVGRDTAFEMNPLHWFSDAPGLCRTPDEIRLAVQSATGEHVNLARERAGAWALRHRAECLSPLDGTTVQAFLQDTSADTGAAIEFPKVAGAR